MNRFIIIQMMRTWSCPTKMVVSRIMQGYVWGWIKGAKSILYKYFSFSKVYYYIHPSKKRLRTTFIYGALAVTLITAGNSDLWRQLNSNE
jgi:hypothetical protein